VSSFLVRQDHFSLKKCGKHTRHNFQGFQILILMGGGVGEGQMHSNPIQTPTIETDCTVHRHLQKQIATTAAQLEPYFSG
jgi:hypothetical protein